VVDSGVGSYGLCRVVDGGVGSYGLRRVIDIIGSCVASVEWLTFVGGIMAAVVGTVGINIRYCCCLSGRSCCCCLHLAKTDQATCCPMVSIRSMQQSNERIYPRPRLEIWSLMTCPSSTRHRAHRASADVYSQTYNQRITPALLPCRVSPTLPYCKSS
jgi:hypothetical protein